MSTTEVSSGQFHFRDFFCVPQRAGLAGRAVDHATPCVAEPECKQRFPRGAERHSRSIPERT
jgi:hypothetical protein